MSAPLSALLAQLPEPMRSALAACSEATAVEEAAAYLAADEATRADMLAFYEADGPKAVHDLKHRHADGTPTSNDLKGWAEQ